MLKRKELEEIVLLLEEKVEEIKLNTEDKLKTLYERIKELEARV